MVINKIVKMEQQLNEHGECGYKIIFNDKKEEWIHEEVINQVFIKVFESKQIIDKYLAGCKQCGNEIKNGKQYISNGKREIVEAVPVWMSLHGDNEMHYKPGFKANDISMWVDGYKVKKADGHILFLPKSNFELIYTEYSKVLA